MFARTKKELKGVPNRMERLFTRNNLAQEERMDKQLAVALRIIEVLEQNGYEAYLVGGCVRDRLMKRQPQDYDVATNARPEEVLRIFPRSIPTGIKHGTVTVVEEEIPIEVTTFRVEGKYEDHRRPSEVRFVSSLKEDLARRDFTINAMAEDRHGRVYDYFGGQEDLQAKQIRTVGNPEERFSEDALRMIRAVRFSAQFGFAIEEKTLAAIRRCREFARTLAVERITREFEKMWNSAKPSIGVSAFFACGLQETTPPFSEWSLPHPLVMEQLQKLDRFIDRIVRWAYFLALFGTKAEEVSQRLRQLRMSNRDRAQISRCFELGVSFPRKLDETGGKCLLLHYGRDTVLRAWKLATLLAKEELSVLEKEIHTWWEEMPVHNLRELAIDGRELSLYCQREPGPWLKQVLEELLYQVALGKLPNQRNALLEEGCRIGVEGS